MRFEQGKSKEHSKVKNVLLNITHSCERWNGVSGGEIGDVYQWRLGLAQAQTFYSSSGCQSQDSLLSSPGITL